MKKRLNDLGVTGGGFFGFWRTPTLDAIDGGEEGSSCDDGGRTGLELGTAVTSWLLSIVEKRDRESLRLIYCA